MVLQAPDQQLVTATGDFCECYMPGSGMEMIHGLPDILDHFLVVFVIMLKTARRERQNSAEADLVQHGVEQIRTVEGVKLLDSVMSDFPDVHSP